MRLQEVIPYMVCVNLASREDRRREAWGRFAAAGLTVDRQPGILRRTVKDPRGFKSPARYACSLAKRLAIRRAKLAGAPAVLMFEDDVVLAPDLHERLAEIELPEDWGIFFLGCKHLSRPEVVAPGLVRVRRAADHHAMAVRAEYYDDAIRGLAGYGKHAPRRIDYSDVKMSAIQDRVPTYAAYPNLAWQALSHSDNAGSRQTHYDRDGRQRTELYAVRGLEAEMEDRPRQTGPEVEKTGEPGTSGDGLPERGAPDGALPVGQWCPTLPQASAADDEPPGYHYVALGRPRHRLEESFPLRLYINLGRREDRRVEAEYQFAVQGLEVERLAAADGRHARNTRGQGAPNAYACRLSHRLALRTARQRRAPAVLVFEDDVIPDPDFRRIAEALPPPPDWGVLFYGCTHVEAPEAVAPGWVKVRHVWGLQAYAVRAEWYGTVLKALNAAGVTDDVKEGADVVISRLSGLIPMYAAYPNLAWQAEGHSDLMGKHRRAFREDGHQNRLTGVLRETNRRMKAMIVAGHGPEGLLKRDHRLLRAGDVHLSRAAGGSEWSFEECLPCRRFLNLDDRPDRREQAEERFERAGVAVQRFAAWKGRDRGKRGGLPAGAHGCALSHRAILHTARKESASAVLVFEDDAVLHPRLVEWAEAIALPEDWGILYFGCQHVESPEPVAAGLVRVKGAYSTHAYAVKSAHFRTVAAALGRASRAGVPCDVALSRLCREIPAYAFYPNLAWQAAGSSDVSGTTRDAYGPDGVQRWHRAAVVPADRTMRRLIGEGSQ